MSNSKIWIVFKREFKVSMGRPFILSTIFIPLVMFAIVGIQVLMSDIKSEAEATVTVLVEKNSPFSRSMEETIKQAATTDEFKLFKLDFKEIGANEFDSYLDKEREALLADDQKGLFYLPNSSATDKEVLFYSINTGNMQIRTNMQSLFNKALNINYFDQNNIKNVDLVFVGKDVQIVGNKVSETGTEKESWGPIIIGGTLALLLLLGVSFNSLPVMSVVVAEKANRVYEVLMSSLKPLEILWGKILAKTAVASLQMLIWVVVMILALVMLDSFVDVSEAFRMEIKIWVFAYYVINYVVGLMLFLTLYAGMAAMYDDTNKASSGLLPVYFAILLPFYTVFSLLGNPANLVTEILSMAPLTSFYVMPARMMMINVPIWQPIVALLINGALLFGAMFVASKVYRISILSSGNEPSLRQIMKWVKSSD